ncbi:MAG TPA: radical SAM protein [Anaerolineae bacterium]|nr:radical SAM protein [Anaerolineae bacterium]
MTLRSAANLLGDRLHALPVAILYITDRCNSRCVSCDYWRFGQSHMSMDLARRLSGELPRSGARYVLLSGGEPLMHPQWPAMAAMFRQAGLRVAMVTSGILLPKFAAQVAGCIDELYVSLDGATPESYQAIRGVAGLGLIERGVRALAGRMPITFRTTVQRGNYREIPALIRLTQAWGATRHSFLAVDVSTHAAFARREGFDASMALGHDDLAELDRVLDAVERDFAAEFASGYIAESPDKLRRLKQYFAALLGLERFPFVRCNAPRFSTVIETDGTLKPCYFLPAWGRLDGRPLFDALNAPTALQVRQQQRLGERPECERCVCYAYRSMRDLLME